MTLDKDALAALQRDSDHAEARYQTLKSGKRRRWLLVGAGAVALLVVLWLSRGGPLEVEVATATDPGGGAGSAAVLNASGYVTARRLSTVSSKMTGRIVEVLFEEGALVQQGQVLARLDDSTAKAQHEIAQRQRESAHTALAEVEVRLAEAVRSRDRARALRPEGLVSQSALDAAEAEAAALQARLESARAELSVAGAAVSLRQQDLVDLVIRAPFGGVIVSKDAQPGEMVSPISAGGGFTRTGIATVVDMDSREIEVDVNEAYINRVAEGQRVEAVLDAYPDWTIPARVVAIVPTADRQKATVRVRIDFDQLDPRILPDMGIKVRFFDDDASAPKAVAAVPAGAVVEEGDEASVWKIVDGKAVRSPIRAGHEREGMRDILEGVAEGDTIILNAPATLQEGARVKPRAGG